MSAVEEDPWRIFGHLTKKSWQRAIFNAPHQSISAVGHETDVTIADYASRSSRHRLTVGACGDFAVFDYRGWQEVLAGYVRRLELSMDSRLVMTRQRLTEKAARLAYLSPENQIREKRMYLLRAEEKLTERMEKKLQMEKNKDLICMRNGCAAYLHSKNCSRDLAIWNMRTEPDLFSGSEHGGRTDENLCERWCDLVECRKNRAFGGVECQ